MAGRVPCGPFASLAARTAAVVFCDEVRAIFTFWPEAEGVMPLPFGVAGLVAATAAAFGSAAGVTVVLEEVAGMVFGGATGVVLAGA